MKVSDEVLDYLRQRQRDLYAIVFGDDRRVTSQEMLTARLAYRAVSLRLLELGYGRDIRYHPRFELPIIEHSCLLTFIAPLPNAMWRALLQGDRW